MNMNSEHARCVAAPRFLVGRLQTAKMYHPPDLALMLFIQPHPPPSLQEGRLNYHQVKHLLPHLQRSVGYLSALVVKIQIGMGVAQLVAQFVVQRNAWYADEYNISTAHAQLRSRAAEPA